MEKAAKNMALAAEYIKLWSLREIKRQEAAAKGKKLPRGIVGKDMEHVDWINALNAP